MNSILLQSILWVSLIGLVCGLALALASRYFGVKEDPRIGKLADLLPGANCGGCGYAGCTAYAAAMVAGEAPANLCAPGGSELTCKLCEVLGVEAGEPAVRKVALVLCGGDNTKARKRFAYNGIVDCAAAAATAGGDKACEFGCLGYGSCARVCPVDAIEIVDGLARVHPEICIGCGKCVAACPRNLIKLVPENRHIHVLCSSRAPGAAVRKVCSVGCIGCRICTKFADGAIAMDGTLAVVNYDLPLENDVVVEKCPGKCIRKV